MLNAAIWLGAEIFCTTGLQSAIYSRSMVELLGPKFFVYLAGGVTQIIFTRLYYWQSGFAVIAWLHLLGEWLYLGRQPRRWRVGLLAALLAMSLLGGLWLGPRLVSLNRAQHALNARAEERDEAGRNFRRWDQVFQALNVLMIGGVAVYFWRVTQPDDSPRFVRPVRF